jgi:hypothetical protein
LDHHHTFFHATLLNSREFCDEKQKERGGGRKEATGERITRIIWGEGTTHPFLFPPKFPSRESLN